MTKPKTERARKLPGFDEPVHTVADHPIRPYPFVDSTGMQWLDMLTGEPPVLDERGRLLVPLVRGMAYGNRERWGVGMTLPRTPAAQDELEARYRRERERTAEPTPQEPRRRRSAARS